MCISWMHSDERPATVQARVDGLLLLLKRWTSAEFQSVPRCSDTSPINLGLRLEAANLVGSATDLLVECNLQNQTLQRYTTTSVAHNHCSAVHSPLLKCVTRALRNYT